MKNPFLLFTLILVISACTHHEKSDVQASPTPVVSEALLTPGKNFEQVKPNDVQFRLYQLLSSSPKNTNFSPISMEMAFGMVHLASHGATRDLIQKIFGFSENMDYSFLPEQSLVGKKENSELYFANSVWAKNTKQISALFLENLTKYFNTEVSPLHLRNINEWVDSSTHHKIQELIKNLDPSTSAIFINALYFKSDWVSKFKKPQTQPEVFVSSANHSVRVQMMNQTNQFKYYEDEEAKWLILPYQNSPFAMLLAIPKKKFNLRAIEDKLSHSYLHSVVSKMTEEKVELKLPKFKFNTEHSLKTIFIEAGYSELFKHGDFSNFSTTKDISISDIIQATAISVDEMGTEAAAATAVSTLEASAMSMGIAKEFFATEPFIFILKNMQSDQTYFMGKVYNPNE